MGKWSENLTTESSDHLLSDFDGMELQAVSEERRSPDRTSSSNNSRLGMNTCSGLLFLLSLFVVSQIILFRTMSSSDHNSLIKRPIPLSSPRAITHRPPNTLQPNTGICRPPVVDPNNEISLMYQKKVSFSCPIREPLSVLDPETGEVRLSPVAHNDSIRCSYSFFARDAYDEHKILYNESKALTSNTSVQMSLEHNLLNVTCYNESEKQIYVNTHFFIPEFPSKEVSSPDKPNVLVFYLESLPQLTFKRLMTKTKKAMDNMGFQYLDNFVKSGENSFPNTMAFLTGRQIDKPHEEATKKDYFDNQFVYIWDYFKKRGYTTGYLEDLAHIGVFNYGKWGFSKQPVDFYPHAFWNQMFPNPSDWRGTFRMRDFRDYCFAGNGYKIQIFLDQITSFMEKNKKHPFFLFAFYSEMTHEDINNYQLVDPFISDFIQKLKKMSENTIIVFAGDHGFRKGSYIATSIGRLEERMNLYSMFIPKSLNKRFPHLRQNLARNSDKLSTWFDIHLMLKEVADGSFKQENSSIPAKGEPISPMRQLIPENRTCEDAGIPAIHCVCGNHIPVHIETTEIHTDIAGVNKTAQSFFKSHCNQTDVQMTDMWYTIPVNHSVLVERVDACFNVTASCMQHKCLSLQRDMIVKNPVFTVLE